MPRLQKLTIGLLLISAAGLVLGALVPWWTGQLTNGEFEIGLRSMSMCLRDSCFEHGLSGIGSGAQGWAKLGGGIFVGSFVIAFLFVWTALNRIWGRSHRVVSWLTVATGLFIGLLSVVFVIVRPDTGDWVPSYGLAATIVAAFLGALATTISSRISSPSRR